MKCINCHREIGEDNMFCNFCGTMQPTDREAYESEHPSLTEATTGKGPSLMPSSTPPQQAANVAPAAPVSEEKTHATSSQAPNLSPPPSASPNAAHGNLMQCPECGSMIPADSAFCPYCRCPFVAPGQQHWGGTHALAAQAPRHHHAPSYQEGKKKGLSGVAITLITVASLLLLGVMGAGIYYFFFYNNVTKLRPDEDVVTFSRQGGSKTVTIITDAREIEVAKSPDWVTVATGDGEITIKCEPLDDGEDREGTIRLQAGDKKARITVRQSGGATFLNLSQSMIRVSQAGEEVEINIDSDGNPETFLFRIQDPYMCAITSATTSAFTVAIAENTSPLPRQSIISVASGKKEKTLTILQAGRCSFCNGSGKEQCYYCDGQGRTLCANCSGTGRNYNDYQGEYVKCELCDGLGYHECENCGGTGFTSCEYCDGTGGDFSL